MRFPTIYGWCSEWCQTSVWQIVLSPAVIGNDRKQQIPGGGSERIVWVGEEREETRRVVKDKDGKEGGSINGHNRLGSIGTTINWFP